MACRRTKYKESTYRLQQCHIPNAQSIGMRRHLATIRLHRWNDCPISVLPTLGCHRCTSTALLFPSLRPPKWHESGSDTRTSRLSPVTSQAAPTRPPQAPEHRMRCCPALPGVATIEGRKLRHGKGALAVAPGQAIDGQIMPAIRFAASPPCRRSEGDPGSPPPLCHGG